MDASVSRDSAGRVLLPSVVFSDLALGSGGALMQMLIKGLPTIIQGLPFPSLQQTWVFPPTVF